MIKIDKSNTVPASLRVASPPTSPTDIDDAIYKKSDVKEQLLTDQHRKCAYCECMLQGKYDFDVEHFRPKKAYQVDFSSQKETGYYWLSYNWQNLLASCSNCNRTYKNDLFPLLNEKQRDIHNKDVSNELPFFINPVTENPRDHLTNHRYMIIPKSYDGKEDVRGRFVVDTFQLNDRESIVSARQKLWEEYQFILRQIELAKALLNNLKTDPLSSSIAQEMYNNGMLQLERITADDIPFSGFLPR